MWQRLKAYGYGLVAAIRQVRGGLASLWQRSGISGSLYPLTWLLAKLWAGVSFIGGSIANVLRWLFIPKADTPLDIVKHYASVVVSVIGLTALLWAAKQIAYPPIVITVANLPDVIRTEQWLNPELSRALIDQIQRMRTVLKDERSPAFEPVLNAPNIVVSTGGYSLNVQEQILTPLGALLGRGQGEAHLAITCFQPNCARTRDSECLDIVPKAEGATPAAPNSKLFLCLRITVDISRGKNQRRITSRVTLNNETYDAEVSKQIARIAESVMAVADPATAALYYYRRVQQERAAVRSVTVDPELVGELRGEAFKAAEQAESLDTVSACWAHTIRARLAIDRRDFQPAETYIALAKSIPWWHHIRQFTLPIDCQHLIAVAEMEFARRIVQPAESSDRSFPEHPHDENSQRKIAAVERIEKVLTELESRTLITRTALVRRFFAGQDLIGALRFALAEVGLSWVNEAEQCMIVGLAAYAPSRPGGYKVEVTDDEDDDDLPDATPTKTMQQRKPHVGAAIRASIQTINSLKKGERLSALTRQAASDFLERIGQNKECVDDTLALAQKLYLNHPDDPDLAQVFAGIVENSALKKELTSDGRKKSLHDAQAVYDRMLDIGDDKVDMFALSRVAFLKAAFAHHEKGAGTSRASSAPDPETLKYIRRAWQRYQRELYPTDSRHRAEFMLAFWGALLLQSYPTDIVDADLASVAATPSEKEELRIATAQRADFLRALQVLFPAAQPAKLADLSALSGIGTRIACLCVLYRLMDEGETLDFYLSKLNKWQQVAPTDRSCRDDMLPNDLVAKRTSAWQQFRARMYLGSADGRYRTMQKRYADAKDALKPRHRQIDAAREICRAPKTVAATASTALLR